MRPANPIRPEVPEPHTNATGGVATHIAELSAYATQLERALAETREARASGRLLQPAKEALRQLDRSVSSQPGAGPPGAVFVRLVGRLQEGRQRLAAPLSDASVRLKVGERVVHEARTDAFGVAALAFPEGKVADCEVEVVGTDGRVLGKERLRAAQARQITCLIELAPANALAGPFARAEAWLEARRAGLSRLDEWRPVVEAALARQEGELTTLLEETRAALARSQVPQDQRTPTKTTANRPGAASRGTSRAVKAAAESTRAGKERKDASS